MSKDSYVQGAKCGQAYNLAVAQAIADGKGTDAVYIFSLYCFHLETANLCTNTPSNEIMEALMDSNKNLDTIQKTLTSKELYIKLKELYGNQD